MNRSASTLISLLGVACFVSPAVFPGAARATVPATAHVPSALGLMALGAAVTSSRNPVSILTIKRLLPARHTAAYKAVHKAVSKVSTEIALLEWNDDDHWRLATRTVSGKSYTFVDGRKRVTWAVGSDAYQTYPADSEPSPRRLFAYLSWLTEGLKNPKVRAALARGKVENCSLEGEPAYRISWDRPPLMDVDPITIGDVTTSVVVEADSGRIRKIVWGATKGEKPDDSWAVGDITWTMYYRDRERPFPPETFVFAKASSLREMDMSSFAPD